MVSSEVQRTLVKSPPELWAELSDPDSLGRHLGALGEIRITRVEPEQRVEWEGENTTGAVSIKPSGWGTKVTISVERELQALAGSPLDSDATVEPDAPPTAADVNTGDDPPLLAPRGEQAQPAPAPTSATPGAATTTSEPAPADAAPDAASTPPEPASSTPEPAIAAEQPLGAGDLPESAPETATTVADVGPIEPSTTELAPVPEPRRGFFARLFGRRARAGVAADPLAADPAEGPASTPSNDAAAAAELVAAEEAIVEALPTPSGTPEPQRAPSGEATAANVGPESATATQSATQLQQDEPPASEEQAPEGQATDSTEPTGDAVEAGDLAAELRSAELVAEEEVTAVLTAVLDRLGAAHHRPFSRS